MKDGKEGYPNRAPYNAIHVGAAAPGKCVYLCKVLREPENFSRANVCVYQCWTDIVFFYTIWVSIMRISHSSDTNRLVVFLFFMPFGCVFHTRNFIPRQNHPSICMG